jgi:type I restriction enzyme R subunit
MLLRQALSLCRSLVSVDGRMEATFFEAVRVSLARFAPADRPLSLKEINDRVNELLKASIKSEGVINLFADIQSEFSLFDDKFLGSIANMKERNLAIEILRKLLAEQVSLYRRTNIVKSEKFSERLARVMNSYINGLITHEECLNELIQEARDVANARAEGREMGLSEEEKAFYDALVYFEGVKEFYEDDVLLTLTHELTDQLRKSRTIDWQRKESARAGMRMMVKRLLKKYKYPPEGMEDAMVKVIQQCELLADGEGGAA